MATRSSIRVGPVTIIASTRLLEMSRLYAEISSLLMTGLIRRSISSCESRSAKPGKKLARMRTKALTSVVGHENADRADPPDGKAAGVGVRAIAEFERGLAYTFPCRLVDLRIAIQCATDRCLRQTQVVQPIP